MNSPKRAQSAPRHPDAFTGPYAITSDNLWLMVWEDQGEFSGEKKIQQWVCLADPGADGNNTMIEAASGIGKYLFAISLSQFRQAIASLEGVELIPSQQTLLPDWMPLLSKRFVIILGQEERFFATMVRANSAQNAMEQSQEQYPGATILSCGSKSDVSQAAESLERVLHDQDTSGIAGDFRKIPGKDPMWLEMMSDPYFRSVAG